MRIVFLLLLSISCLAQKRLVPLEYYPHEESETFSLLKRGGITVYAECFDFKKDLLVFDIEIINESGKVLTINPEETYYYKSEHSGSFDNPPIYAKSKKSVYNYHEKKIQSSKNTKSLLAILGTSLIIYDALSDVRDFRSEPTRNRLNRSIARDIGVGASLITLDIADGVLTERQIQSDEDLYFLPEEILLPAQLFNGEAIRGKVYFHHNQKQKYYRLAIPIEDLFFVFDFRFPNAEEKKILMNY